jgi:hypothetical protein
VFAPEHCPEHDGVHSKYPLYTGCIARTSARGRHRGAGDGRWAIRRDGPTIQELSRRTLSPPPALDIPAIMVTPPLTSSYY